MVFLDNIPPPRDRLKWLRNDNLEGMVEDFENLDLEDLLIDTEQEIDWQELKELDNLSIVPPSLFIGGEYDPVRRFIKDYDAYKNAGKFCEDFKGCYIIKDAGHWVQQEKPKVNKIIKNF